MKKFLILIFILLYISSAYAACPDTPGRHGVEIEGECYDCGESDDVCPEDFEGVTCDVHDSDPAKDGGDCGPSLSADCELINADWVDEDGTLIIDAVEGDTVYLEVESANCEGQTLSFDIFDVDRFSGDDYVDNPLDNVTITGTITKLEWEAEYIQDGLLGTWFGGDPEYIFQSYIYDGIINGIITLINSGGCQDVTDSDCSLLTVSESLIDCPDDCLDIEDPTICEDCDCGWWIDPDTGEEFCADDIDPSDYGGDEDWCDCTCINGEFVPIDDGICDYDNTVCTGFTCPSGVSGGQILIKEFPIYDYWNLLVTVLILFVFYVFKKR